MCVFLSRCARQVQMAIKKGWGSKLETNRKDMSICVFLKAKAIDLDAEFIDRGYPWEVGPQAFRSSITLQMCLGSVQVSEQEKKEWQDFFQHNAHA